MHGRSFPSAGKNTTSYSSDSALITRRCRCCRGSAPSCSSLTPACRRLLANSCCALPHTLAVSIPRRRSWMSPQRPGDFISSFPGGGRDSFYSPSRGSWAGWRCGSLYELRAAHTLPFQVLISPSKKATLPPVQKKSTCKNILGCLSEAITE